MYDAKIFQNIFQKQFKNCQQPQPVKKWKKTGDQ